MHPEYCSKREPLLVLSLDGQNNVRALSPREKWNKTFTKSTRTLKYGHSHARAQCITINRYKQKPHVPTWADRISPRPVWTGWGESDLYCSTSFPSAVPHPIVHQSSNFTPFFFFAKCSLLSTLKVPDFNSFTLFTETRTKIVTGAVSFL